VLALLPRGEAASMAQLQQSGIRNRLLASLLPDDFALAKSHLEPIALQLRQHLFLAGRMITHVTFPESGIASIVADTGGDGLKSGW
jgi:CRP-like cAMP-binding protein